MSLLSCLDLKEFNFTLEVAPEPKRADLSGPRAQRIGLRLTTRKHPSAPPIESWFRPGTNLEDMLIFVMRKHYPDHPSYLEWREGAGYSNVELVPDVLECVGEAVHTALRKCADSKESAITWNAIHAIAPEDGIALWEAIRSFLAESFAAHPQIERRSLGEGLKVKVLALLDEREHCVLTSAEGRRMERLPAERFALKILRVGCEMTSIEEWMYGWLGFVVEEPADADEDEPAQG